MPHPVGLLITGSDVGGEILSGQYSNSKYMKFLSKIRSAVLRIAAAGIETRPSSNTPSYSTNGF